ncbi:MAG: hypothetical protein O7B81_02395 [Gammaproteobacteria bacterium]|nr:hypothetical protein [Gammaproteobacteria bacterium]
MAHSLHEGFVDEQGHHAVLDEVAALFRDRHPEERDEVGARDADLGAARPRLQPLRHDGPSPVLLHPLVKAVRLES